MKELKKRIGRVDGSKSDKGFTLIETLVYLALFALIIGGLVVATYLLFETSDRYQTRAMVQEEENFIIAKIVWALDNASIASVSGGSTLTITKHNSSIVQICLSGTDAKLLAGAGTCSTSGSVLNNSNVTVNNLSFIHTGGGVNPESIEIDLTLGATTPTGKPITQSVSMTRYIRK